MITPERSVGQEWPELPFSAWSETAATLHMCMQVVGKIRLVRTPWTNHSWHVPFYVTARGLGTSLIPYDGRAFSIEFDLLDHQLVILVTDGGRQTVALEPRTVADFYRIVIATLATLGIEIRIHTMPCEVPDAIRFEHDTATIITIPSSRPASGRHWCRSIVSSRRSGRASSASAVRCISSGAASIWP